MKKTIITAIILDHVLFPRQAAGELITRNGEAIGSHLRGHPQHPLHPITRHHLKSDRKTCQAPQPVQNAQTPYEHWR